MWCSNVAIKQDYSRMSQLCPKCNAKAKCVDSRRRIGGVSRRFNCACGCKFSTAEILVTIDGEPAKMPLKYGTNASLVDRLEAQVFWRWLW